MDKTTRIERVITALFFFLYFQLGYLWGCSNVANRSYDFSLSIDRLIPMTPAFIIFYFIGYLFVFSFLFIKMERKLFRLAVIHYFGILTISFLIFKIFPVYMEKDLALGSDLFSRLTFSQQTLDSPYNNFPSLHVSLNLFTFSLLLKSLSKQLKVGFGLIVFLIIISTVLVKQHLFIDLVAGVILGITFAKIFSSLFFLPESLITRLWKISLIMIMVFSASQYQNLSLISKSLINYTNALF